MPVVYTIYMYNHILYLTYWLINTFVLLVASSFLGQNIVLGNWRFNDVESAVYAGFWITFIIWIWWDFAIARKFGLNNKYIVFAFFLFVNFFAVWAVSGLHDSIGFKKNDDFGVLIVALVITILQRIVRRFVIGKNLA
jgi:hypothetical protein